MLIYVSADSDGKGDFVNVEQSTCTIGDSEQGIKDIINSMYPITKEYSEFKTLYGFRGGELYVFSRADCPLLPYPEDDFEGLILVKSDGWGHYVDITEEDVTTFKFGQKLLLKTTELLREIGYYPSADD